MSCLDVDQSSVHASDRSLAAARKVEVNCSATPGFALCGDMPASLFDESMGPPKVGHASSRQGKQQLDIPTPAKVGMMFIERGTAGFDHEPAARRHGIARVCRYIHDGSPKLGGVDLN